MVNKLITISLRNRYIVLFAAGGLFAWGTFAVRQNPIDAIPDLSENQVIVFTEWQGRSPQILEDQITFPAQVQTSQNTFKIRMVQTGKEADGYTEILSGLQPGDAAVTSGAYLLQSAYIFRNGADPMAGMDMSNMKM